MLNNNYARNYQHESALLQMNSSSLMYLTQVLVLMNYLHLRGLQLRSCLGKMAWIQIPSVITPLKHWILVQHLIQQFFPIPLSGHLKGM